MIVYIVRIFWTLFILSLMIIIINSIYTIGTVIDNYLNKQEYINNKDYDISDDIDNLFLDIKKIIPVLFPTFPTINENIKSKNRNIIGTIPPINMNISKVCNIPIFAIPYVDFEALANCSWEGLKIAGKKMAEYGTIAGEQAAKYTKEAGKFIANNANAAANAAKEEAEKFGRDAAAAANRAANATRDAANAAANGSKAAAEAANRAANEAKNQANKAANAAANASREAAKHANKALNIGADIGEEGIQATANTINKGAKAASNAASASYNTTVDAANTTAKAVSDAINKAGEIAAAAAAAAAAEAKRLAQLTNIPLPPPPPDPIAIVSCFSKNQQCLIVKNNKKILVNMDNINIGDDIITDKGLSKVIHIDQCEDENINNIPITMIKLYYDKNKYVIMTQHHLIYKVVDNKLILIPANDLKIGDDLYHIDNTYKKIIKIEIIEEPPIGILTINGNINVNGIICSSYTTTTINLHKYLLTLGPIVTKLIPIKYIYIIIDIFIYINRCTNCKI